MKIGNYEIEKQYINWDTNIEIEQKLGIDNSHEKYMGFWRHSATYAPT